MRRSRALAELAGAGRRSSCSRRRSSARVVSTSTETYFIDALVKVAIVVALYVFIGNSGVLSFGHISFVALGAWTAGVLSVPRRREAGDHAEPRRASSATRRVGNVPSLLLAAAVGGVFALVVGLPLMRLSGLAAGIATFAVLEITHNLLRYYEKIGPGPEHVLVGAGDDGAAGRRRSAR